VTFDMTRRRVRVINTFLGTLIAGSVYCIAADNELWPFSNYPMYSGLRTSSDLTLLRLFGVTPDGRERRLTIGSEIPPFDRVRLRTALRRLMSNADEATLDAALRDCWKHYEAARVARAHDGPPLVGMRLYELHWEVDPMARDADRPDSRKLLAEISVR
jgi:hypothetical protein